MKFWHRFTDNQYLVEVIHYRPPCPMRVTGTGYGDADPPEDEEFDYLIYADESLRVNSATDHLMNCPQAYSQLLAHYKQLRGLR